MSNALALRKRDLPAYLLNLPGAKKQQHIVPGYVTAMGNELLLSSGYHERAGSNA